MMATVTVLRGFRDLKAHRDRVPGEVFEAPEERAAYIAARLPGYVEVTKPEQVAEPEPQEDHEADLTKLTVPTLRSLCEERGIEVPKRAKKADILALLTKE